MRCRRAAPNAAIYDLYGLTETGSCDFVLPPAEQPHGLGTIGAPTEGVAFRIDATTGELLVRTPFGMLGYLDNPQLTAEVVRGRPFQDRRPGARRCRRPRRADRAQQGHRLARRPQDRAARNRQPAVRAPGHRRRAVRRRAGRAARRSASTPRSCCAPAPALTPDELCATGCWRAPSASRCRRRSTSATRCRPAPPARPTAAASQGWRSRGLRAFSGEVGTGSP